MTRVLKAAIPTGLIFVFAISSAANKVGDPSTPHSTNVTGNPYTTTLAFTRNDGQWPDSILFRAGVGGSAVWFVRSGVIHQFVRRVAEPVDAAVTAGTPDEPGVSECTESKFTSVMVKKTLIGAKPNPVVRGELDMTYKCNFIKGNDPSKWRTDVPNFEEIRYVDIYPGIDLRFYGNGKQLEYDFIVSPGADYRQIRFEFDAPEQLALTSSGDLQISLSGGAVTEKQPVIFQDIDGLRKDIRGGFVAASDGTYGFSISSLIDPNIPLVIDPALVWDSYLGGSVELPFPYSPRGEEGVSIAVGSDASVYVTGSTPCSDFPTLNALDNVLDDGSSPYPADDAFVTKFNPGGTALVYSTYLGGSRHDRANDIAVDATGNVYVVGETGSYDYPLMNPYQATAGLYDAFVTKLGPAGNTLVYSTRLGGSCCSVNLAEACAAVVVDALGFAYVVGHTSSSDFPTTAGAYQTTGPAIGFVAKFSQAGNSLEYCTLLGDANGESLYDIAVDASGNAWVTGRADGTDYPLVNPLKLHPANGNGDMILTKLNSTGSALLFSTYWGSENGWETGNSIAIDAAGSVYVTGSTDSPDFPLKRAFDTLFENEEAFVTTFATNGDSIIFSTYLGGAQYEDGDFIAVAPSGGVIVVGQTNSGLHFPIKYPLQGTIAGGYDFFVTQLCAEDYAPVYSTYFGGTGDEHLSKAAIDAAGNVYLISTIDAGDPVPLAGPWDNTLAGTSDAFVCKLSGLQNPGAGCCIGQTGNIDCDPCDRVDIGDLTVLIDNLYLTFTPLCCEGEANCDGTAGVDIGDVTALIDNLFKTFTPLSMCP